MKELMDIQAQQVHRFSTQELTARFISPSACLCKAASKIDVGVSMALTRKLETEDGFHSSDMFRSDHEGYESHRVATSHHTNHHMTLIGDTKRGAERTELQDVSCTRYLRSRNLSC